MATKKMSPAGYVIHMFGGVRKTARAVGVSPASVCRWRNKPPKRGSNGFVPSASARLIMAVAKKKKMDITPEDLMFGREVGKQ